MPLTTKGGNNLHPGRVKELKRQIFNRDNWRCVTCSWTPPPEKRNLQIGATQQLKGDRFLTLDHIKPQARGGSSQPHNLQTMCNLCNENKGDRLQRMLAHKGTCRKCGDPMTLKSRRKPDPLDWYCC